MAEWALHAEALPLESRWAGAPHPTDSWRKHSVHLVQLCIIAFRVEGVFQEMLKHFVFKDTSLSVWGNCMFRSSLSKNMSRWKIKSYFCT